MTEIKELLKKISELSGESRKSEISALFRELKYIKSPETVDALKKVYKKNIFSEENYKGKLPLELEKIKDNCLYIRRSSILALIDELSGDLEPSAKNTVKLFLLNCLNDKDHGIRSPVLKSAPKYFNLDELIKWYEKVISMETEKTGPKTMTSEDFANIRRGLIFVLGEKALYVTESQKNIIVDFVEKILTSSKEKDPNVRAAAAEILGKFGSEKHIKILEDLVGEKEYPTHLRASDAIKEIKQRSILGEEAPEKTGIREKINTLQSAINILQEELNKYKDELKKS